MKKHLLFILFLFGFFFYMPNVFADTFDVCSNCVYTSLDDALTDAENTSDEVYIYLYDNDSYTITSHTFNYYVYIYDYEEGVGTISIDGDGATLQSNYQISFYNAAGEHTLKIENVNFVSEYFYDEYFVYIEYFNNLEISNVDIIANDSNDVWTIGLGLDECYGTNIIDSVTIEGFYNGIELDDHSATIQNSVLSNNLFSICAYDQKVKVINTELSFINLRYGASIQVDGLGDKTIIIEEEPSFGSDSEREDWKNQLQQRFENKEYENHLLIIHYFGMGSSQFKKTLTVNNNNSFNLLDTWFEDSNISDFEIENLNDEVVSIEDGVVKPLKNGNGTIILTDNNTGHEYRLSINVEIPTIINPKTGNTFWFDCLFVLFIFFVLGGYVYKKQH